MRQAEKDLWGGAPAAAHLVNVELAEAGLQDLVVVDAVIVVDRVEVNLQGRGQHDLWPLCIRSCPRRLGCIWHLGKIDGARMECVKKLAGHRA